VRSSVTAVTSTRAIRPELYCTPGWRCSCGLYGKIDKRDRSVFVPYRVGDLVIDTGVGDLANELCKQAVMSPTGLIEFI